MTPNGVNFIFFSSDIPHSLLDAIMALPGRCVGKRDIGHMCNC